ncbi:AI-2E family transporter [Sphingomonas daechungensis]|uniref:AI-2E family transporter n=1 Tax=Sphingomonas daechungensis TaxID=1176646 RepID=A0ABX6SZ92_9SPHN|nr:AI-2E family transporter [Sphingomonas daechungensis]QNP42907.1 AI-2E family transporter [Sphingomonas daechungensis]
MARKADESGDRQFVRRVLIVLGLGALFILAWQLRTLLLMFFGAIVVATVFRAFGDRLEKAIGCRNGIAVALSITTILGLAVGLIALFGSHVAEQVEILRRTLPVAWHAFEARMGDLGLGDQIKHIAQSIRAPGGSSLSAFAGTVLSIGSGIADVIVVIVAGVFLATQPRFYLTGAVKLIPPAKRSLALEAVSESENALRLWLRGQLIAMVVVGLLTGLGLWALGMPSAFVLGLMAGVLEFIPFIGPILSTIPAILLALAVGPDQALWVLLLYFAVQQFEGYILTPLVQQYAVDLPGVILLFALIAFGILFGTLGVILAAPLTVVAYVLVKRLYVIEVLHTPTPIPGETKG